MSDDFPDRMAARRNQLGELLVHLGLAIEKDDSYFDPDTDAPLMPVLLPFSFMALPQGDGRGAWDLDNTANHEWLRRNWRKAVSMDRAELVRRLQASGLEHDL
jgi:hypothetical protein